jgi:hypothetical protein
MEKWEILFALVSCGIGIVFFALGLALLQLSFAYYVGLFGFCLSLGVLFAFWPFVIFHKL